MSSFPDETAAEDRGASGAADAIDETEVLVTSGSA